MYIRIATENVARIKPKMWTTMKAVPLVFGKVESFGLPGQSTSSYWERKSVSSARGSQIMIGQRGQKTNALGLFFALKLFERKKWMRRGF